MTTLWFENWRFWTLTYTESSQLALLYSNYLFSKNIQEISLFESWQTLMSDNVAEISSFFLSCLFSPLSFTSSAKPVWQVRWKLCMFNVLRTSYHEGFTPIWKRPIKHREFERIYRDIQSLEPKWSPNTIIYYVHIKKKHSEKVVVIPSVHLSVRFWDVGLLRGMSEVWSKVEVFLEEEVKYRWEPGTSIGVLAIANLSEPSLIFSHFINMPAVKPLQR